MADLNIDTTSPQYQAMLNGIDTLESQVAQRWPKFRRLSKASKLDWLQRDPLLKKMLLLVYKHSDKVGNLAEEIQS